MTPLHLTHETPRPSFNRLSALAWGFIGLGTLAIIAPFAAGAALVFLFSTAMILWGGLGVLAATMLRGQSGWLSTAIAFGLLALVGVFFLIFPATGMEAMALMIVAGLLLEGIASVLMALRLSGREHRWRWMLASGATALVAGIVLLIGWPATAEWLIGMMLGLNFVITGTALLVLRKSAGRIWS